MQTEKLSFEQPTSQYATELTPASKERPMYSFSFGFGDHGCIQSSSHIYVGANPFRLFAFANTAALLCRGPVVPLWITEINLRHL